MRSRYGLRPALASALNLGTLAGWVAIPGNPFSMLTDQAKLALFDDLMERNEEADRIISELKVDVRDLLKKQSEMERELARLLESFRRR